MPHVAEATDEAGAGQRQLRAPIAAAATAGATNGGVRVEYVNDAMQIEVFGRARGSPRHARQQYYGRGVRHNKFEQSYPHIG